MILDYHMPFVNGLDIVGNGRKLYSDNGLVFPKVMILTAIEDPRLNRECIRDKMVEYFETKPISTELLDSIISNLY